jgi:hypothetical protein
MYLSTVMLHLTMNFGTTMHLNQTLTIQLMINLPTALVIRPTSMFIAMMHWTIRPATMFIAMMPWTINQTLTIQLMITAVTDITIPFHITKQCVLNNLINIL